ncbi:MAG: amidohydrolase, partial [Corynebacterium urealyticum]
VLVPQPRFIAEFGDAMAEAIGAERAALSYPGKRLLERGVVLPGSSDRPVATGTPLAVVQSFVERTTAAGKEYGPEDRITVDEALYAYTAGSAAATGWAGKKGQIAPGQLADLVVLGADPAEVPASQIGDIPVEATVLGGQLVHGSF